MNQQGQEALLAQSNHIYPDVFEYVNSDLLNSRSSDVRETREAGMSRGPILHTIG